MSPYWIAVAGIVGSFAVIIIIALAAAQTKQRQMQHKAEVQMKLIERFATSDEFVRFIKSDEGRDFLGDAPRVARRGFLGGVRWGTILMFMGLAFLILGFTQHERDFYIPAWILLGLGGGFFVSATLSMKLAREMEKNPEP